MKSRKAVALFVAFLLVLGMASLSLAGVEKPDPIKLKGTITAIDGANVTIQDAAGALATVAIKNVKGFKIGDMVSVNGDKIRLEQPKKAP